MTVTTSAVPAVRLRLFELVVDALPDIAVTYGVVKDLEADNVIVGGLLNDENQQVVIIGAQSHDEEFTLGVHITVGRTGRDPQEAFERAYDIFARIETLLRDNSGMGLTFYVQARVARHGAEEIATDEGARVDMVVGVLVNARLQGR